MAEIRGPVRKVALALLATCSVAAFGPQSHGADLGIAPKAPPMAAPFGAWAGGYFGSFIGFGWGNVLDSTTLTSQIDPYGSRNSSYLSDTDGSSALAGSLFGYNWQSGRFVYGIEADITRTDISADSGATMAVVTTGYGSAFAGGDAMTSIDWYGTLRVRGGVILNDRWMIYGTGGLAYGKVDLHGGIGLGGATGSGQPYSLVSGFHDSSIKAGWVVGAGIEWQHPFDLPLIRGATVSLAYQYVDLGSVSATQAVSISGSPGTARGVLTTSADAAFHVVRVGAAWRMGAAPFGSGGGYSAAAPGWAGFYVGGHAGGIWSAGDFLEPVSTTANYSGYGASTRSGGSSSPSSGFFGAQGGYNWQSGAWVYGFELDGSVTNLDASSSTVTAQYGNVIAAGEAGASLSWVTSVRARMGYAFDRMLVYGTAGIAGGKVNFRGSVNTGGIPGGGNDASAGRYASFDASTVEYGWTVGAGIDYQIRPDLIANFGYQYVDLGDISGWTQSVIKNYGTGIGTVNVNTDLAFHMFRVGLSYRN